MHRLSYSIETVLTNKVTMKTEWPIPSCREVFRKRFREFPRLVGRYCS